MILNIRRKLFLGYLAMALLTIVASTYAVGHLRSLNNLAEKMIHQDARLLDLEKKMMDALLAWEGVEKRYLILKDPSLADIFWTRSEDFQSQIEKLKAEALPEQVQNITALATLAKQDAEIFVRETVLVDEDRLDEAAALLVRILVEVIDAVGVEERRAPLDAVDDVALAEEELGEVGAVLAGDAGDERDFGGGHGESS